MGLQQRPRSKRPTQQQQQDTGGSVPPPGDATRASSSSRKTPAVRRNTELTKTLSERAETLSTRRTHTSMHTIGPPRPPCSPARTSSAVRARTMQSAFRPPTRTSSRTPRSVSRGSPRLRRAWRFSSALCTRTVQTASHQPPILTADSHSPSPPPPPPHTHREPVIKKLASREAKRMGIPHAYLERNFAAVLQCVKPT